MSTTGGTCQYKENKEITGIHIGKEEVILLVIADSISVHLEEQSEST